MNDNSNFSGRASSMFRFAEGRAEHIRDLQKQHALAHRMALACMEKMKLNAALYQQAESRRIFRAIEARRRELEEILGTAQRLQAQADEQQAARAGSTVAAE